MRLGLLIPLLLSCSACVEQRGPTAGTLLLSNLRPEATRVEAVLTANPDCGARGPGVVGRTDFVLPPNATRIIAAPPGADVCWRREREPPWSGWNRAYLAPGRTIDTAL